MCATSGTRCAGTMSATPAVILSRLSPRSSPTTIPNRAVSARATGPYAWEFSSAMPDIATGSATACAPRDEPAERPTLAHAGLAEHDREHGRPTSRMPVDQLLRAVRSRRRGR